MDKKTKPTKINGIYVSYLPEYILWEAMLKRCNNKDSTSYPHYGGRGIKVCDRWQGMNGFLNFYEDVGKRPPGLTLDRINNDGDYEPGNVSWVTQSEQNLNQRKRTDNPSGYTGVYWFKPKQRWMVAAARANIRVFLGYFDDKEEAALAYDCAAIQLFGDSAKVNLL